MSVLNNFLKISIFLFAIVYSQVLLATEIVSPTIYEGSNQGTSNLVRIRVNNSNYVLSRNDNSVEFQVSNDANNDQLWWIVQDYDREAFALVSATDGELWLVQNSSNQIVLANYSSSQYSVSSGFGQEQADNFFFEFEMRDPTETESYLVRSKLNEKYFSILNRTGVFNTWSLITDTIGENANLEEFYFNFDKFGSEDEYLGIPVFDSPDHSESFSETFTTISASTVLTDNQQVICSQLASVLDETGDKKMFKIIFNNSVNYAQIGLLDYRSVIYKKEVYKAEGNRRPVAGIEKRGNSIYLFNKSLEKELSFSSDIPIYFGYKSGKIFAQQGSEIDSISGVSQALLLNSSYGNKSRLLLKLENGQIEISYRRKSLYFHDEDGEYSSIPVYATNPDFSSSPTVAPTNNFDWRTPSFLLRYKVLGSAVSEEVTSPFYDNSTVFSAISAKYSSFGEYQGGEDFNYFEGWEIITHDFGYNRDGTEKSSLDLRTEPYMVLYNRFTGKLRVFVYITNPSIANQLRISISDGPQTGVIDQYRPAMLWGTIIQGAALDDPNLSNAPVSSSVNLPSTLSGRFCYADFILGYDPCITEYESNLKIKVEKVTSGTLSIVGRTLGGNVPVGSSEINDWLSNSDNFLTGVMSEPYGNLQNTLGQVTFRDFERWDDEDWSNEAEFVLPGKKVQDWEREVARLKYEGEVTMSAGDFLSGTGKILKGSAKIAQVVSPPLVNPAKVTEGVGELIDAAGTLMKGSGRSMKAVSAKIYYDNLVDQPDKTIPVQLPNPQPSVVFSELAAKGSVTISTTVFDDLVITTPGSKHSEIAPVDKYLNGGKGIFSFYNEVPGVFNILYQPEAGFSIAKLGESELAGYLKLKSHPYLVTNLHNQTGYSGGYFIANYVITTYDKHGNVTEAKRTNPRLFTNSPQQSYLPLPLSLDVSEYIDKQTILDNLDDYGTSTSVPIENWIAVDLEVTYYGYTGKAENGEYGGVEITQSAKVSTSYSYLPSTNFSKTARELAREQADLTFSNFNGNNHPVWGSHHVVTDQLSGYESEMNSYCSLAAEKKGSSDSNEMINKSEKDDERVEQYQDETEDIEKNESLIIYPNPSSGIFNIEYNLSEPGDVIISIFDLNGKQIISHNDYCYSAEERKRAEVNLSGVRNGVYIITIEGKSGLIFRQKLIKFS